MSILRKIFRLTELFSSFFLPIYGVLSRGFTFINLCHCFVNQTRMLTNSFFTVMSSRLFSSYRVFNSWQPSLEAICQATITFGNALPVDIRARLVEKYVLLLRLPALLQLLRFVTSGQQLSIKFNVGGAILNFCGIICFLIVILYKL